MTAERDRLRSLGAARLAAAISYAGRGWPVLPLDGKLPLIAGAWQAASTDPRTLRRWWRKRPTANIGIATGWPAPTVLDVDDPSSPVAQELMQTLAALGCPMARTGRAGAPGTHFYLAGGARSTIKFAWGEWRATGSHVVAPPSVHPETGAVYGWLVEPPAPGVALPSPPASLIALANRTGSAGSGVQVADGRVPYHQRHDHLKDLAVRLVRGGVLDERRIAVLLEAEFGAFCEPKPPPRPDEFTGLARWAARSDIAGRERSHNDWFARKGAVNNAGKGRQEGSA